MQKHIVELDNSNVDESTTNDQRNEAKKYNY